MRLRHGDVADSQPSIRVENLASNVKMNPWLAMASLLVFIQAINALLCKWNNVMVGTSDETVALVSIVLTSAIALVILLYRRAETRRLKHAMTGKLVANIVGLALTNIIAWCLWVRTVGYADNPGVVHAIVNTDIVLVMLASAVLFGSPISMNMIIGAVLIVAGLAAVTQ